MPNDNEPRVTVHGIPQSEYNSNPPANAEGGVKGWLTNNWVYIALGLGAITLFLLWRNSSSNNSTGGTGSVDPTTGLPANYGSQLDAYLQQIISNQNQLMGVINGQSSTVNNAPTTTNTSGSTTAPPATTNPSNAITSNTQPTHNQPSAGHYYTIAHGDTLSSIAQKEGFSSWQQLYNFQGNAQTIQKTAQSHGQWNPGDVGHWIYPGERLAVH